MADNLTVSSLTFAGTGPVVINSSSDLKLTATGVVSIGAPAQLVSKTKAELKLMKSCPAGSICWCPNTAKGGRIVYFNGTAWVNLADGII
jgi:hypothetical protein